MQAKLDRQSLTCITEPHLLEGWSAKMGEEQIFSWLTPKSCTWTHNAEIKVRVFYFSDTEILWKSGPKVNYKLHKILFPILYLCVCI